MPFVTVRRVTNALQNPMPVTIREVDFDADRFALIDLLKRNRKLPASYPYSERYDWLYLNNPHGIATGWKAIDEETNKLVGFTVALPRKVSVLGQHVIAWNCADFSIDVKYRTLGVAAKLRRAAQKAVDNDLYPFLYAHPNDLMLAVHKRVGHTVIGQAHRHARILSVKEKVKARTNSPLLLEWVSAPINSVLDFLDWCQLFWHRYDIEIQDRLWYTGEFTKFYNKLEGDYPIWGVRDAPYLNWRYYHNPIHQIGTAIARKHGEMVGYVIYRSKEAEENMIEDVVASSPAAVREMIAYMSIRLRKRLKCGTLSINLPDWHPYLPTFKKLGFMKRSDSTNSIVVHISPNYEFKSTVLDSSCWFVTGGDRDE